MTTEECLTVEGYLNIEERIYQRSTSIGTKLWGCILLGNCAINNISPNISGRGFLTILSREEIDSPPTACLSFQSKVGKDEPLNP